MTATLRLLELHTCPLWVEPDGSRTIGMTERPDYPLVVGWVNVGVFTIAGERYELLMALP